MVKWEITDESVNKFMKIVHSWKKLFLNAPEEFDITGEWVFNDNDSGPQMGQYEKIMFSRIYIVDIFSRLENLAVEAKEGDGGKLIFHRGI